MRREKNSLKDEIIIREKESTKARKKDRRKRTGEEIKHLQVFFPLHIKTSHLG